MSADVLTLGSLFAGIGGLEYGLEMTGRFKTVWQVEKDAYCRKVLAKHWPDVTRYEDVKDVGKENLSPVDVICGGFPCQDVSIAGKRGGLVAGNRSGLWHEYARIVHEMEPRYVIVENVTGLLVDDGLGYVLGSLAEIGYDAEWEVLSAADVGLLHRRDRIFILAYSPDERRQGAKYGSRPSRNRGRLVTSVSTPGSVAVEAQRFLSEVRAAEFVRTANGLPERVERIHAIGNAVAPRCAKVVGEWLLEIHDELTAVA